MKLKYFIYSFIILLFLTIWQFSDYSFVLSSPYEIFSFLLSFLGSSVFWENLWVTFTRVWISCVIALVVGIVLALTARTKLQFMYDFIYPTQFISAAMLTLISIVLFGLSPIIPIFVVTVAIIPNVYVACDIGLRHMKKEYMDFGKLYAHNKLFYFWYIILPQLIPYLMNGLIRSHAVAWKVVVTAELFVISQGLGYLLNQYFRFMHFDKMLALSIVILFIAMISDYLLRKGKGVMFRDYNTSTF